MRYFAILSLLIAFGTALGQPPQRSGLAARTADSTIVTSAIGVTRRGTPIPCRFTKTALDLESNRFHILFVGGMDGQPASTRAALDGFRRLLKADKSGQTSFAVSCVPRANPDGATAGKGELNQSGGRLTGGYPPSGRSYNNPTDPERQYLWRWVGMHAPDLVVDVRLAKANEWRAPAGARLALLDGLELGPPLTDKRALVVALARSAPSGVGSIPAIRCNITKGGGSAMMKELLRVLVKNKRSPSPARRELQRRLRRSPIQIAIELSRYYGHDLRQVVYIPALALLGRLRLGELTGDENHQRDVHRIVSPYLNGKPTMGKPSGSGLSGHLIFSQLAARGKDDRMIRLARKAADLGFDGDKLRKSMPAHHEMSDSVFMGCPILAETGKLTGQSRYYEMCVRHLQFMHKHCLRKDGLYRHSPLDEAAWGRGNGFPALGLALVLSAMPEKQPGQPFVLKSFRQHLAALRGHQDPTGAWHQVVDHPESYREFTSTCMITFAMIRGVRRGWLAEEKYGEAIRRGWYAIKTRIGNEGHLVDVCTGTGKQKNLRAYYDRTAILGRDARGGAMALLVSTEMAAWKKK